MSIKVKDFMSTSVTTAEGILSVGEIKKLMEQKAIHAVPIVYTTDNELVIRGIITSSDLCNLMDEKALVEDAVRFKRVFVVSENASAKSAAEMMIKHKTHHIVVMEDGQIVGIISSLDFVKIVAEQ